MQSDNYAVTDTSPGFLQTLGRERLQEMLHTMCLIRQFEDKAEQLYMLGKVHGTMHLSAGEEASAVGIVSALRPDDYVLSTHRGHGHCLAKGAEVGRMMAEFLAKETGYCRGRGGSMHIANVDAGNLGANGVVAGGLPIAVGVGLSIKLRRSGQVCVVFFGDGAANEGAFHESLNMASIWDLPVVYVCENNHYGMSMPVHRGMRVQRVSDRASAYAIPGVTVDGQDVLAVYEASMEAVERARSGGGPTLLETVTYRYKGHSKSDQQAYRTRDEVKEWMTQRDPIRLFRGRLEDAGIFTGTELDAIEARAADEIAAAIAYAEGAPEPDPDALLEGVYA